MINSKAEATQTQIFFFEIFEAQAVLGLDSDNAKIMTVLLELSHVHKSSDANKSHTQTFVSINVSISIDTTTKN